MDFKLEKPSWAKGLRRHDLYYEGLIDSGDLESILEDHKGVPYISKLSNTSCQMKPFKFLVIFRVIFCYITQEL